MRELAERAPHGAQAVNQPELLRQQVLVDRISFGGGCTTKSTTACGTPYTAWARAIAAASLTVASLGGVAVGRLRERGCPLMRHTCSRTGRHLCASARCSSDTLVASAPKEEAMVLSSTCSSRPLMPPSGSWSI